MRKVRMILPGSVLALVALVGCRSAHTTSAILYLEEQEYEKAIQVIHEGFEYRDDEPDAYYYLGEAHSRLAEVAVNDNDYEEAKSNYDRAYQNYTRARELDSEHFTENVDIALQDNYNRRLRQGVEDFRGSFYEQAEGHFRLAYAALPDSITPIKNIARMKMQQSREVADPTPLLNEALDLLDQVLTVNPGAYSLQADKANVLVQLGRNTEADTIYRELLKEHGDDPNLLIDIVNLAVDQQEYERAADLTIQVIEIYKNDSDPTNDGEDTKQLLISAATWLASEDIRRYDEALDLLDQALDLETFPSERTLLQRLQTFYDYGLWLKQEAEKESDPLAKANQEQQAQEQFRSGVQVGNALVSQYPKSCAGFLILAQCQFEVGDGQAAELNITEWQKCSEEQD